MSLMESIVLKAFFFTTLTSLFAVNAQATPTCEGLFEPFNEHFLEYVTMPALEPAAIAEAILKANNSGSFEGTLPPKRSGERQVALVGTRRIQVMDHVVEVAAFITARSNAGDRAGISVRDAISWFRESLEAAAFESKLLTADILLETLKKTWKRGGLPNLTSEDLASLIRAGAARTYPASMPENMSFENGVSPKLPMSVVPGSRYLRILVRADNAIDFIATKMEAGELLPLMQSVSTHKVQFEFRFPDYDGPVLVDLIPVQLDHSIRFVLVSEHLTTHMLEKHGARDIRHKIESAAARERLQSKR